MKIKIRKMLTKRERTLKCYINKNDPDVTLLYIVH